MDVTNRDRLNVLNTMFAVIREAHEYAHIGEGRDYYHFVDGVLAMTEMLLKEIDERPNPVTCIEEKAVEFYNSYMNAKLEE